MKARAEKQGATRMRIVEAIAKLHSDVGPAATTVSAIAEAAAVERLTVYRHFPTDASMFAACGAHWRELHPRPNLDAWREIVDPLERLKLALSQLYAFYDQTEGMTGNIMRDERLLPELAKIANFAGWMELVTDRLCEVWPEKVHPAVRPAIRLAVDFNTWQLLVRRQQLSLESAVELALKLVL